MTLRHGPRSTGVRPGRRPAPAGRRALRRPRDRRRHHRRRRRPRRRRPGPAHRARRAATTSPRARRRSRRSWCTAGLRYLQQRRVPPRLRGPGRAPAPAQTPRTSCRLLPFLIPVFGKDGVVNKKLARAFGTRHVDVRPHRRRPHRQAPQAAQRRRGARPHAHAHPTTGSPRLTSTTTPRPTTPGSRSTIARTAALDHGAVVANRAGVVGCSTGRRAARSRGATRRGRRRAIEVRGPRRRQRHRRVGRRRPGARRGRQPRHDPPGQGHPHHGAVGQGALRHRRS